MVYQRILVLAPHTDDAELGCGGAIARFVSEGSEVYAIAFSTAQESLPAELPPDTLRTEFLAAMPKLGVPEANLIVGNYPVRRLHEHRQEVLEQLVKLQREIKPDMVMLPSVHDMHQDHQVVHMEGLRAFKSVTVLGYELPWNNITFDAQAFVVLQRDHVDLKINALQAYKSQVDLERPYFKGEFIEGWVRLRGLQVKSDFAEAFEVVRVRW